MDYFREMFIKLLFHSDWPLKPYLNVYKVDEFGGNLPLGVPFWCQYQFIFLNVWCYLLIDKRLSIFFISTWKSSVQKSSYHIDILLNLIFGPKILGIFCPFVQFWAVDQWLENQKSFLRYSQIHMRNYIFYKIIPNWSYKQICNCISRISPEKNLFPAETAVCCDRK